MIASKSPRFSVRVAVAMYLKEDDAEVEKNRRYQPTRTPCPVYTVGNDYLTATSGIEKSPKADREWNWQAITGSLPASLGWQIWQHVEPQDDC